MSLSERIARDSSQMSEPPEPELSDLQRVQKGIDQRLGVSEKCSTTSRKVQEVATKAKRIVDEQGVTSFVEEHVFEPSASVKRR